MLVYVICSQVFHTKLLFLFCCSILNEAEILEYQQLGMLDLHEESTSTASTYLDCERYALIASAFSKNSDVPKKNQTTLNRGSRTGFRYSATAGEWHHGGHRGLHG